MTGAVTHVGVCVGDLERAERFYVEALGFTRLRDLRPPDQITGKLLAVPPPVGLTAVYLGCGEFVLELLHFDREGNDPARGRSFTEPGLTHISMGVEDLPGMLERVVAHGGAVLRETDVGAAILVRDPDGQIVELVSNER